MRRWHLAAVYAWTLLLPGGMWAAAPETLSIPGGRREFLSMKARDVDGDHDPDLVVSTIAGERVGVWLNDGTGNFSRSTGGLLPEWIWTDLPEWAARGRNELPEAGVAMPDDSPAIAAQPPGGAIQPLAGAAASRRSGAPCSSIRTRNCIRPPPTPLFS